MKIIHYKEAEVKTYSGNVPKGVAGRVVIGKADGAKDLCMRVFELEPGTYTGKHAHEWEHEVFRSFGKRFDPARWQVGALCHRECDFYPGRGRTSAPERWERAPDFRLRHPDRSSGNVTEPQGKIAHKKKLFGTADERQDL